MGEPQGDGGTGVSEISGERVLLRTATDADAERFRNVLAHPGVAQWWGDPEEALQEVLQPDEGITSYAIDADGTTVGVIQSHEELTPLYRHAGIDIAVHPDWHRRGIGADAVHALARYLITERGHHRLTIDPAAHNDVAIRVYEQIGFRPVGIMRQYERGPDGTWHDGLLMDMLANELTAPDEGR